MAAPKIIKWSDPGVPQLDGREGSLVAILDYALPLLGWTILFTGQNKRVYLNSENYLLRINDRSDRGGLGTCFAGAIWYESMVDIDNGAGAWGAALIWKTYNQDLAAYSRPYCIIGDSNGFWFINAPAVSTPTSPTHDYYVSALHYFGKGVPVKPDTTFCLSVGARAEDASSGWPCTHTNIDPFTNYDSSSFPFNPKAHRSKDGALDTKINIQRGGPFQVSGGAVPSGGYYLLPGYSAGSDFYYEKHALVDVAKPGELRGYLPGLICPCHGSGFTNLSSITIGGKSYLPVRIINILSAVTNTTSGIRGWLLFDLDGDFR